MTDPDSRLLLGSSYRVLPGTHNIGLSTTGMSSSSRWQKPPGRLPFPINGVSTANHHDQPFLDILKHYYNHYWTNYWYYSTIMNPCWYYSTAITTNTSGALRITDSCGCWSNTLPPSHHEWPAKASQWWPTTNTGNLTMIYNSIECRNNNQYCCIWHVNHIFNNDIPMMYIYIYICQQFNNDI